ncbi:MAG: relaxase [Clostridia bacterium]|nr:relaxase [Clostridia bacterium]
MAVCWVWDVKGRLDHSIDYATNPEKTTNKLEITDDEYQGLRDVMDYASKSKKTTAADTQRYVDGVNCNFATARSEMVITKKQFADESEIIAFHAFQSFAPNEVDEKTAHEIGVKLAEKMWGERFQVVVATHLNTNCLHNHFVINSTSFVDGKRYYDNKANLKKFRDLSDGFCKEYGLSIIENADSYKTHSYLYRADKSGMPTRYNLAKEAIDEAISHSYKKDDFFKQLSKMGYSFDFRDSRKYATIKPKEYAKSIRIHQLGSEYTKERIFERIKGNSLSAKYQVIQPAIKSNNYRNITRHSMLIAKNKGGLGGLYLHYCYKLGILPKGTTRNNARLHYLLKEDLMKLDKISAQAKLLYSHHIDTMGELSLYKELIKSQAEELKKERQKLWNETRKITSPEQLSGVKKKISECSKRIKQIRVDVNLCDDIESRSPTIVMNLEQVEKDEKIQSQRKEKQKDEQWRRRS